MLNQISIAHQAYRDFVDKNSDKLRELRRGWQKANEKGDKETSRKYMEQMKPINREAFRLKENAEKKVECGKRDKYE